MYMYILYCSYYDTIFINREKINKILSTRDTNFIPKQKKRNVKNNCNYYCNGR